MYQEGVDVDVTNSASLFSVIDDSVFQVCFFCFQFLLFCRDSNMSKCHILVRVETGCIRLFLNFL